MVKALGWALGWHVDGLGLYQHRDPNTHDDTKVCQELFGRSAIHSDMYRDPYVVSVLKLKGRRKIRPL